MKKTVSGIVLILLLMNMLTLALSIQPVKAESVAEDPFNYQGRYTIDETKLAAEEKSALPYVQKCAEEQRVSPALLMAMIKQESNFDPNAIGDAGLAIGYMQLHWDAAYDAGYRSTRGDSTDYAREDWPTDGLDPSANIKYGCAYLKICYDKHKDSSVYSDPLKNAVSAYNLGWPHGPDKSNENSYVNPILQSYESYKGKYARTWGKSRNVAVIDDYYGSAVGYLYPSDYPSQTFSTLSAPKVSAETLANYDTVILFMFNPSALTTTQKAAINDWIYKGGKLIIWDSDQVPPGYPWDYTWLPYPFTTSTPGQTGAHAGALEVMEENQLSSSDLTSPYYIDTDALVHNTDAVGDATVLITYSPGWRIDMMATNVLGETGPAHVYAAYGSGLMIYSALDWDYAGYNYASGTWLKKMLKQELECSALPFVAPPVPGEVGLKVEVAPEAPEGYYIDKPISFNVTVTNPTDKTGINIIAYNVEFNIIVPEQIEVDTPTTSVGDIAPGESKTFSFGGSMKKAGENVEVIVNARGEDHTLWKTIAGSGSCLVNIHEPEEPKPDWSFAVITDLHIGYCTPDYDGTGFDDGGAGEDYYITELLRASVETIIGEKDVYNIKFVAVLGDFADTAEKSEFLKAREILNRLNDAGIPYIPVVGDHDQWPYTQKEGINPDDRKASVKEKASYAKGDEWFNDIFWGDSNSKNLDLLEDLFGFRPTKAEPYEIRGSLPWKFPWEKYTAYLQNRNFSYGGINFVCLDFNPREKEPGAIGGNIASHYEQTKDYLKHFLETHQDQTTMIFSHHPLYELGGFLQAEEIAKMVYDNKCNGKIYNFAGHTHCNRPSAGETVNVPYYVVRGLSKAVQKAIEQAIENAILPAEIKEVVDLLSSVKDVCEILKIISEEPNLQKLLADYDYLLFKYIYYYKVIETEPVSQIQFEWPEWIPWIGGKPIYQLTGNSIRIVQVKDNNIDYSKVLKPSKKVDILWPSPFFQHTYASYPEPNKEITFTAYYTSYYGFKTSFDWDFGDGTFGSGSSVKHSYAQEGEYTVTLTVTTRNLITGEVRSQTVTGFVYVYSKHVISHLPSDLHATSLLTEEDLTQVPKNTYQPTLITKNASEEIPIAELEVHFEEATEDIDLSTLVADVNLEEGKSVIYMPSWPNEIGEYKTLFIPSTGSGTVYICLNAMSLEEVSLENADLVINVGETKDNITVATTFYNGEEYYLVSGVTGTGGGELKDTIPPTTLLTIGEPKYITEITYVTPDTPFNLTATDNPGGTGVALMAYKIRNATYDSGWLTYTEPFHLSGLADGVYSLDYNSTDNANNVEPTNTINVTLFSWNYIYQDTYRRGTTLKINLAYKFFQFTTPDKDYGIRKATYMKQCGRAIIIEHRDKQLRLITISVDTKLDFCYAMAWDLQTRKCYLLIDKPGIEK